MFVKFWEMFEDAMQCYGCWRAFNHFDPIMYHHRKCPTRQSSMSRDFPSLIIQSWVMMSWTERPDNNDSLVFCRFSFSVVFPLLLFYEQKFMTWLDNFCFWLPRILCNCSGLENCRFQHAKCNALSSEC